jgi:hypothetical protein
MPGLRVQHPVRRNCRYTVVERVPYTEPFHCPPPQVGGCGRVHVFKTYHLNLDETGAVVISRGVYDRIAEALWRDGFRLANTVADPPTIGIGLAAPRQQFHIEIVDGGD